MPAYAGPAISLRGIFACVPFAIWLFITVEQTGSAAEEADNPGRSMSRGILAAQSPREFTCTRPTGSSLTSLSAMRMKRV